jgi:hypothetical protein
VSCPFTLRWTSKLLSFFVQALPFRSSIDGPRGSAKGLRSALFNDQHTVAESVQRLIHALQQQLWHLHSQP